MLINPPNNALINLMGQGQGYIPQQFGQYVQQINTIPYPMFGMLPCPIDKIGLMFTANARGNSIFCDNWSQGNGTSPTPLISDGKLQEVLTDNRVNNNQWHQQNINVYPNTTINSTTNSFIPYGYGDQDRGW